MRRIAKNPEVVIVQNPSGLSLKKSKGMMSMRRRRKSSRRRHRVSRRKHMYNKGRRHTRKSRRNKGRKVSAYARFVGQKMRGGMSMKAAARAWKSH